MTGNAFTIVQKKLFAPEHEWTREKLLIQRKGWAFLPAFFRRRAMVWDYIPENIRRSPCVCIVRLNGRLLNDGDLHRVRPKPGDILEITPLPGIWGELLVSGIIAIALMILYLGYEFGYNRPREERAKKSGHLGSTYLFDRFMNTSREGTPIPVIYGEHRIAGHYLQIYTSTPEEGYDVVNALVGVCEGPICSITDFWINGTDAVDLVGALTTTQRWYSKRGIHYDYTNTGVTTKIYTRTGERDQAVIPGFDNTVTSVSYNDQLLWGSAVTLNGTTTANKFRAKIQFTPYGLWYQDSDGHAHSSMFEYRYRYRSNGGAWGGWNQGMFDHRRKEPFSYWLEVEVNATTAVTIDVQIERTSRDSDPTNGIYATAYVKEYQQVLYDDIRYVSTALYGFEAVARQKVCDDIPAFTALVQGMMLQEFLTGVRFYGRRIALSNASYAGGVRTYTTVGSSLPFITGDKVTIISTTDYPGAASNWSAECIAVNNVTGNTFKVAGTDPGAAIVGGYVCWPSKNPACVILDILFSRRYGLGNYIDRRIEFGVTGASGSFTVGEIVTDADGYRGTVKACTGTLPTLTLIVESDLRFPTYGSTLTGASSGKTATVGDIVEIYSVDIASFYNFYTYCNDWVNSGTGVSSIINFDSISGTKTVYVASSTGYATGQHVLIGEGTAREEHVVIVLVVVGGFTIEENLQYTHTAVQADEVHPIHHRSECDIVFDGQMPAWDAVHRIASNALAGIWKFGSKLYVRPIESESPVATISAGNIKKDSFKIAYPAKGDRPNVIRVKYLDKEADYADSVAAIEDQLAVSQDYGITADEHDCYGVTRREEALRIGIRRLKEIRYALATCEWDMDIDAIAFEPLDVVRVQSDVAGWGMQGGRVVAATASTLTLDKVFTVGGGTYYVRVTHSDGTTDEYKQITSAAGEHKIISIAPSTWAVTPTGTSTDPNKPDIYAIGTVTGYQIRIMKIELRGDDLTAHITAIRDSASMYDNDIETVPALEITSLPDPRLLPPDVTSVTLNERKGAGPGGELRNVIDVSFIKPVSNQFNHAEIYFKEGMSYRDSYGRKREEGETLANGTLSGPSGVCTDGTYIYLLDSGNHRLIKLNYHDLAYVAQIGDYGIGNDQFKSPQGITTDGTNLYIADTSNNRIVKRLCSDLSYVDKIGSKGAGDDQFNFPMGIFVQGTNLYVADTGNHRIQKRTTALVYVSKIGSQGAGDDQFQSPHGICADTSNVFVADTLNYRLHKRDTNLVYVSKVGSQGYGANTFCGPRDITVEGSYLYVTDCGYDGVEIKLKQRIMTRAISDLSAAAILSGGVAQFGGYCGSGLDELYLPRGIDVDSGEDYMFIADSMNGRIMRRRISDDPKWIFAGESKLENFTINEPMAQGSYYRVAVLAVSAAGAKKTVDNAPTASILIGADAITPLTPVALYARMSSGQQIYLSWDRPADRNTVAWEIRKGTDWASGTIEGKNLKVNSLIVPCPIGASATWHLKAINSGGKYSAAAASVTLQLGPITGIHVTAPDYSSNVRLG